MKPGDLFIAADPALDEGTIGLVSFKVGPDGKIEILDAVKVTNVGAGLDLAEQRRRVAALVDRLFAGEGVPEYLDRLRRKAGPEPFRREYQQRPPEAEPRGAGPRVADAFERRVTLEPRALPLSPDLTASFRRLGFLDDDLVDEANTVADPEARERVREFDARVKERIEAEGGTFVARTVEGDPFAAVRDPDDGGDT